MAGKSISANRKAKRLTYKNTDQRGKNKLRRVRRHCRKHPNDNTSLDCLRAMGGSL